MTIPPFLIGTVSCVMTMGCGVLFALGLKRLVSFTSPRVLVLLAFFLGVTSAVYFQGSFLHGILLLLVCFYGLLPLTVVAGVMVGKAFRSQGDRGKGIRLALLLWLPCVGAVALSGGLGKGINAVRVHSTRAYVAQLVPLLDLAEAKTGSFPVSLSELAPPPPPRLAYAVGYFSEPGLDSKRPWFRLSYDDPTGLMNWCEFSSWDRTWKNAH